MRLVSGGRLLPVSRRTLLVADRVALARVGDGRDVAAAAARRHRAESALRRRVVRVVFDVDRRRTWLAVKPLLTVLISV